MISKVLFLTAVGISSLHSAQSQSTPSICDNSTLLIDSRRVLTAAQECTTVAGDIVIQYASDYPATMEFPNLESVDGSFLSINFDEDIRVTRLSAPKLTKVWADVYISRWVNLTTINMPVLTSINRVRLNHLPSLTSANFLSTLETIENNYEVTNTSLKEIKNDKIPFAVFVEIFDNKELEKLELTALTNASYNIALRRNKPGVEVSLPALKEVFFFEFQRISSLEIPELERAIGHFLVNDSTVETLEAPKLRDVGIWYDPSSSITNNRGLLIQNSGNLKSLSFPVLEAVQLDLLVRNNSELEDISFPMLKRVTGNVGLEGTFESVRFPELDRVGGVFSLGNDEAGFNCADLQGFKNNGTIRGAFSCPQYQELPARSGSKADSKKEIDDWLNWSSSGTSLESFRSMNAFVFAIFASMAIWLV
ncbi:hypothetical protein TWF788_006007 [Orbilia oligospora]|uniref:Receptor L-domain domain-containing protein n=1 Tax=Orbilia oligospora TaxID=2813651 RepID=A0A7C8JYE4_ORBOL|nr:hypothetical protein TWF788_006007 [Orbilia oligospora]